jgi:hypothetical protein
MDQTDATDTTSRKGSLRGIAKGVVNVVAFTAAALGAVVDVLRGRWDGPARARSKPEGLVAPLPIDD